MAKKVKLQDISEAVGVSVVSVSKALSGKEGVSDEMREKIMRVAGELGYRYNKAPSTIASSSVLTGNIGVVMLSQYADSGSYYWKLYQEIVTNLTSRSRFSIIEIVDEQTEKRKIAPMMLKEKKVDGVFFLGKADEDYICAMKERYSKPVMMIDFYNCTGKVDAVVSDNFYGSYVMTSHLISAGHKKIGFVGTVLATSSITDRYFGFSKAMLENGLEVNPEWIIDDRELDGPLDETRLCLPDEMPTAFVCNCDVVAGMLIHKLLAKGYRVPEDVSVTGYDNYTMADPVGIKLATFDPGMSKMAQLAVETMLNKISGDSDIRGVQIVTGNMIQGESVKSI